MLCYAYGDIIYAAVKLMNYKSLLNVMIHAGHDPINYSICFFCYVKNRVDDRSLSELTAFFYA